MIAFRAMKRDGAASGPKVFCTALRKRTRFGGLGHAKVGRLLIEYADYLVGDICFQLRFEATMDDCDKLPLLLTAVVQHASANLSFFLDVFCPAPACRSLLVSF